MSEAATAPREVAAFVGPAGQRVMAIAHLPDRSEVSQVVICCGALYSEQITSYRTFVLLARRLATLGVAVVRFEYRGTGNSDDPPAGPPTFESMVADVELVAAWAEGLVQGAAPVLLSSRVGSLVAAHEVSRRGGCGLVLLEPVLDGQRYFDDILRARRVAGLRHGLDLEEDTMDAWRRTGEIDAFGNRLAWSTYVSLRERRLGDELRAAVPVPTLVVQMATSDRMSRRLGVFVDELTAREFPVETRTVTQTRSWWFVPDEWEPEETRPETVALLREVSSWMAGDRT